MTKQENHILWLALSHVEGLGPVKVKKLFQEYRDIEQIWLSLDLNTQLATKYKSLASHEFECLVQKGIKLLTLGEADYPKNLFGLPDIPPVLYVKGDIAPNDAKAVAVVGSRYCSNYGREVTEVFSRKLAANGFTIISGMAKGVDSIAHKVAIDNGGRTIAVWGSGLDMVHPRENQPIVEKIIENGAIISQFPLGVEAQKFTFPLRNKLIAGLSLATLVTEARAKSGSLLTAQAAQKYNRPVFAVPGSIFTIGSAGPHQLIQHGASLTIDAADIVKTLNEELALDVHRSRQSVDVTELEKSLLQALEHGPQYIDDLIRQSQLPPAQVSSQLIMLELKGLIRHLGEGQYRAI